jgi:type IV pilus assembly protein PilB
LAQSLYEILTESHIISPQALDQAVTLADQQGAGLFSVLIEHEIIAEKDLLQTISKSLGLPFELVDKATIDHRVNYTIPEAFARERQVLPLFKLGNTLSVAITNPFDIHLMEDLSMLTKLEISPIITLRSGIESLLTFCYSFHGKNEEGELSMTSLYEMGIHLIEDREGEEEESFDIAQEAPIAKLVETIIRQSIIEKASDIHVEPEEDSLKIRFRIDGLLKDVMAPPKKLETAILSRLKILANLDITETRKPQDGRITFPYRDKEIDFRVSTVRTINGEKMVLRILDKSGAFVSLDKLGLGEGDFRRIISLIGATSGVIVVCGPTGSGKTSTLYSALSKINTTDKNIITIEDPVEYNLEGINQIPVNPKIGVDFATGLTAIVRQDPDVIMVGEVRDYETASIAIQAALTGHLVFTTLHTRNVGSAITRLTDMGVAPFLLSSAIIGVVGQRLVRVLCPGCKRPISPDEYTAYKHLEIIGEIHKRVPRGFTLYKGEGCKTCDQTGYKGRIGIFEVMAMSEDVRRLVVEKSSSEKIQQQAIKEGMSSMVDDGLQKIISGITTIDEISRVLDM